MKTTINLIALAFCVAFMSCETENVTDETNSSDDLNRVIQLAGEKDDDKDDDECETAYAFHKDALCFLDDAELNSNKWGWSIGPLSDPFSNTYEIYQAAGQCNLDNGELIGYLDVSYVDGVVLVDYFAYEGYGFFETHLFVGDEKYPRKRNGQFTVAPGSYTYSHTLDEGDDYDNYKVDDVEGEIYIIAHAVVCPFKKEEDPKN